MEDSMRGLSGILFGVLIYTACPALWFADNSYISIVLWGCIFVLFVVTKILHLREKKKNFETNYRLSLEKQNLSPNQIRRKIQEHVFDLGGGGGSNNVEASRQRNESVQKYKAELQDRYIEMGYSDIHAKAKAEMEANMANDP